MALQCPACQGEKTIKNGHTHYGKQNYQCKDCRRQFVEGGTDWFVTEEDKLLINRLLLERISLTGICRVCQVSLPWLLSYLKGLYAALPDDLNADLRLPPQQAYLDERLAEEVERLMAKKKHRRLAALPSARRSGRLGWARRGFPGRVSIRERLVIK